VPPVFAPRADDKARYLTTHGGHMGVGSFATAAPSGIRQTVMNSTDPVLLTGHLRSSLKPHSETLP
jgi:hypothetical protein